MAYDKPLCASLDGFTLHAATHVETADLAGREALLRYVRSPLVAQVRIEAKSDGLVRLTLKRPFADGTVAVEMAPSPSSTTAPTFIGVSSQDTAVSPQNSIRSTMHSKLRECRTSCVSIATERMERAFAARPETWPKQAAASLLAQKFLEAAKP